jgi:hypothetical protein
MTMDFETVESLLGSLWSDESRPGLYTMDLFNDGLDNKKIERQQTSIKAMTLIKQPQ